MRGRPVFHAPVFHTPTFHALVFYSGERAMQRAISLALAMLAITAILPAAAQESGGLRPRSNPVATLEQIDANRGCPLSSTSVTVGVNRAFATGSSATQHLGTAAGPTGNAGCRPLVSTQVTAGVNLALGGGSQAGQSITTQAPRGVLATTSFTRGANVSVGAGSVAAQRIQSLTGR
jgi:hypothetical protein